MKLKDFYLPFLKRKHKSSGVVGVEFASDGVAIVNLVDRDGEPLLRYCEFFPETDLEQQTNILHGVVESKGFDNADCHVVLNPLNYELLLIEAPQVEENELVDAVKWRVKDLSSIGIEESVVDAFPLPEDAYRGHMKMVYAVVAHREVISQVSQAVHKTSLELKTIDIAELALRNFTCFFDNKEDGTAILRLKPENGVIDLCQGENIYLTRNIEVGIDSFDVPKGDPNQLSPTALDELMNRMILEIQRSLDFYESQLGKIGITSLLVAPLKHRTQELIDILQPALSVRVRSLAIEEVIDVSCDLTPYFRAECLLAIGTALGYQHA